jgi:hypothetical protein
MSISTRWLIASVSLRLDCREGFEILSKIVRKDESPATALHGAQCARTNRLVKGRPTGTRD